MLTVIGVSRVSIFVGHTALAPLVAEPFEDTEADGNVPFADISQVVLVSSQYSCCESNKVVEVDTLSLPKESTRVEPVIIFEYVTDVVLIGYFLESNSFL